MISDLGIIVPAHDEEAEIIGCLQSIIKAISHARRGLHSKANGLRVTSSHLEETSSRESGTDYQAGTTEFRVIVVADACADGTVSLVENFISAHPVVELLITDVNNVGRARNAGVELFLKTSGDASQLRSPAAEQAWLALTDADSHVPVHWVSAHLQAAEDSDCLVGTVAPRVETGSPELIGRWHAAHELDEQHAYVFGANLGIRASLFDAIGGIPPLATGEDAAVVDAILAKGGRVWRSDSCRVLTSARLDGRAPGGFSTYLRGLV
ncbi:glycosyltransferase [Brevibacterium permense]|uniref:glycosyltransferase n=1 Tax=Brevibacterium permense TaxID=234834 RepID=UPI0021D03B97|nr:glycosyltransferase [Brevibacterium permense]MCU4296104.1 glycosyltransferase [Brevibacterium permense]